MSQKELAGGKAGHVKATDDSSVAISLSVNPDTEGALVLGGPGQGAGRFGIDGDRVGELAIAIAGDDGYRVRLEADGFLGIDYLGKHARLRVAERNMVGETDATIGSVARCLIHRHYTKGPHSTAYLLTEGKLDWIAPVVAGYVRIVLGVARGNYRSLYRRAARPGARV